MPITYTSINSARSAVLTALATTGGDLPEGIRAKLIELNSMISPVDGLSMTAEFIYARRADLPQPWRDIGGALAAFAGAQGWYSLDVDGRGKQIQYAMDAVPDPDNDPEAMPQFAVQPAPPEEETQAESPPPVTLADEPAE